MPNCNSFISTTLLLNTILDLFFVDYRFILFFNTQYLLSQLYLSILVCTYIVFGVSVLNTNRTNDDSLPIEFNCNSIRSFFSSCISMMDAKRFPMNQPIFTIDLFSVREYFLVPIWNGHTHTHIK